MKAILGQYHYAPHRRLRGVWVWTSVSEHKEQLSLLKKQKSELENKLKRCKVNFGMGDIDEDIYTTTVEVIQEKLAKIEVEMAKVKRNLSNHR